MILNMPLKTHQLISTLIFSSLIQIVLGNIYDCRRLNDCQNGGTCSPKAEGCSCPTGFSWYNCQVIDGTTCTSSLTCNNNGVCYVDGDTEKCACPYGYFGDTCESETVEIGCKGTTTQFNLTFPEVFAGSVKLSGSDVPGTCSFTSSTSGGYTTYSLTVDTEQDGTNTSCGRENVIVTGDTSADSNYTGQIEVRYYDLIVSSTDQLFTLTCKHIGGGVDVSKQITNIGVDPEGNLTQVEVSRPYSPLEFEFVDNAGGVLSESLYVGDSYKICFFLTDTSVYKNVYIRSCTTNNTLESPANKTYDIYDAGCPTRKSMRTTGIQEAANKTIDGVTYPSVCLPVTAFKFIDSENLALSCNIKLCKENDSSCELPTETECNEVIQNEGATTTAAPDTNTTDSNSTTNAPDNNANSTTGATGNGNENTTTVAPENNDNSTTNATGNGNDNSTTAAPDNNANSTTDATGNGNDNTTTAAADNNADNSNSTTAAPDSGNGGNTTDATGGGSDETTDGGTRRRRRAADDTEEKTVSTIIKVYGGQRASTTEENKGQLEATVEECLSRTEIMAVVTVLGSAVLILFIACFILICVLIKRKSKMTLFEPHPLPKHDRFQIPRAHVNQAYREI